MKILVAVKRTVDFSVQISIREDGSGVETTHAKMSMNPFDEIALEEAVRLREKGIASELIAVSIGSQAIQETLRHALALGADRALLVETNEAAQPLTVAKILQAIVMRESVDLCLLGKQAIDTDDNQVGQMLAGLLQWGQGTFASKVNIIHEKIEVTREVDGGLETVMLQLPAVITADLRLNQPRYLSLLAIMKAKQKPLVMISLAELGIVAESKIKILKMTAPQKERKKMHLQNAAALVNTLREMSVIP